MSSYMASKKTMEINPKALDHEGAQGEVGGEQGRQDGQGPRPPPLRDLAPHVGLLARRARHVRLAHPPHDQARPLDRGRRRGRRGHRGAPAPRGRRRWRLEDGGGRLSDRPRHARRWGMMVPPRP